jgi:hypothetical protein
LLSPHPGVRRGIGNGVNLKIRGLIYHIAMGVAVGWNIKEMVCLKVAFYGFVTDVL